MGKRWNPDLGVAAAPEDEAEAKKLLGIPSNAAVRTLDIDHSAVFLLWSGEGYLTLRIGCVAEDAVRLFRNLADRIERDPSIRCAPDLQR